VHTLLTLDGTVRQGKTFRRAFQLHKDFCSVINLRLSSKTWNKGLGHQF
jgi:hypothetical protein